MQGQRGVIGSFQETLGFENHGSSGSSDGDQQICWETNLQNSQSNNGSDLFLESINQEVGHGGISMWTMGEAGSSSGSNPASHGPIEPRPDRGWPGLMKTRAEPPVGMGMLQLGDHGSLVPHNATVNPLETYRNAASSSSFSDPFGPSSDPYETDNRRLSRKRKAVELSVGQSSSGNMLERPEGGSNMWHAIAENPPLDNNNPIIPRLGLGVSGIPFENPVAENARRNVQLRISSSRQQDPLPASNNINNNNRQSDISALYPSLRLNPVDFRSLPAPVTTENPNTLTHRGQPGLRIPALRRNLQSNSRWSRSSSSRANRSSNLVIPVERNEIDSRTIPIPIPSNISDHPLFAQPTEINWSLNGGGGTVSNGGNGTAAAASSQAAAAPLSVPPSSSAHRNPPHYHPRRLSAFLRRSLLSATDLEAAGGLNGNLFARIPPPSASSSSAQDLGIPISAAAVSVQNHHQQAQLRASSVLVGRQVEGTFGFPYLSRSMIAGSEGRGRLVSEIRNVLDLMRRGEPLRFEDIMILDQSVLYGIADVHDRHRDMRLDIDNMSYEELLALEERIGNVNTGLTEEKISKHLKQKQYLAVPGQPDAEPCCVCQEEYKNGDDLGTLECGHEFHRGCIKQWLQHKNSCPICKSTGFGGP